MLVRDWDRVAPRYFDEVVSPLRDGVPARLLRALEAVPEARRKTIGDLGCGVGTLLPALAARFRRVVAIDFSPAMLARARRTCPQAHVRFERADLADLRRFARQLDVAVTVNALLTPDPTRLTAMFSSLRTVLRPGGLLLGVFPAMEAVLYQGLLIHERERHAYGGRARVRTRRILEEQQFDFVHATYAEDGRTQKFFYAFELAYRLRHAGFRRVRVGRLEYAWGPALGGYESFPGEAPMWDWLVRAEAGAPSRRRAPRARPRPSPSPRTPRSPVRARSGA
jgi:SAM-dependent methyltransferase